MTDGYLMDANCIHGKVWYECEECEECETLEPLEPQRPDTIELLLGIIESRCSDFLVSNGGGDTAEAKWIALGYWRELEDEGAWEIDVQGNALYEVLFDFINHPRFGQ